MDDLKEIIEAEAIRFVDENGSVLAEVNYPIASDGVAEITHTFVSETLRGQGIASRLLEDAVRELTRAGRNVRPICSYAVAWFGKHPEHSSLLA